MKYLKLYEDFNDNSERISIFSQDWKKLAPKELFVINSYGQWKFIIKDLLINDPVFSLSYFNDSEAKRVEKEDVLADGEPDFLTFDISVVKSNDGRGSNPDSLKLNIDVTYGDNMASEFTIQAPNIVEPHHYNGTNSVLDSETIFAFTYESLQKLAEFFNRFDDNFKLTPEDFKFLDPKKDSYLPKLDDKNNKQI